jgi:hypothetical protein
MPGMRRREFVSLFGGAAAAWPVGARAQQPGMPVIGFLDGRLPDALADRLRGFRQGLKLAGYAEGENVAVVYRFAENQPERLPALAVELVRLPVAVIVASGGPNVTFASKAATTTIPIVFLSGEDPVRIGLVASLARPSGNLTGINFVNRGWRRSSWSSSRTGARRHSRGCARQSGQCSGYRDNIARRRIGRRRYGTANSYRPRQHKPRDRCSLRGDCKRTIQRPFRCRRSLLQQQACPIVPCRDAPHRPCDLLWARVCRGWAG